MPVHDWSRVDAGVFHDFHNSWITELRNALNSGILPSDYYALGEQIAGGVGPDVLTLRVPSNENDSPAETQGAVAVTVSPPKVRWTMRTEIDEYALRQRTIVIRHASNHRVVALVEIVSQGNKNNRHAIRALLDKAAAAIGQGIHLLLIDLQPPGPRDPHGIHVAFWERLTGEPPDELPDKPLTLVAYAAGPVTTAYVEPVAFAELLPDMPLFLTSEEYINVPLEATYRAAYAGVPRYYREILER